MQEATGQFFVVSIMGIVIGLAGAHIMYAIHRFLPTTSAIDAALSLMTPYILFLAAEEFHFSGVMAVVSGGLFISYRSHEIFKYVRRLDNRYLCNECPCFYFDRIRTTRNYSWFRRLFYCRWN